MKISPSHPTLWYTVLSILRELCVTFGLILMILTLRICPRQIRPAPHCRKTFRDCHTPSKQKLQDCTKLSFQILKRRVRIARSPATKIADRWNGINISTSKRCVLCYPLRRIAFVSSNCPFLPRLNVFSLLGGDRRKRTYVGKNNTFRIINIQCECHRNMLTGN